MSLILEQSSKAFDGYQYVYSHESWTTESLMKFGVYVPNIADRERIPLLIFLSDFGWNEQHFITRSGFQRLASMYGFIVANPDTSPRLFDVDQMKIEEKKDESTFGVGAGYFLDATEEPWKTNFQMFSYVNEEFLDLLFNHFNVDPTRVGIFGFGMGGHGALISFLKNPGQYKSVSALAPLCNPTKCSWGIEAFRQSLGSNVDCWNSYDACELLSSYDGPLPRDPILIDQGSLDPWRNDQLNSKRFFHSCENSSFPIQFREQIDFDHSDQFLSTFLEDHFFYHKKQFE